MQKPAITGTLGLRAALTAFLILLSGATCSGAPASYVVRAAGDASAVIGANGIESVTVRGVRRAVQGATALEGLSETGPNRLSKAAGEVVLERSVSGGGRTARIVERFSPGRNSIRWEVEIHGEGGGWTAPILTVLRYPARPETRFWTAWSDPVAPAEGAADKQTAVWNDPLRPVPMAGRKFWYGAPYFTYDAPRTGYCPMYSDLFSVPIASFVEASKDFGLSVVLSPEGEWLDLTLETAPDGKLQFSRHFHRLGAKNTVQFALDLAIHEADWRGGLRWMAARYPAWFEPALPFAHELSGTSAYSGSEVAFDAEKMKRMAFRTNWKASVDFPYMGMFLPPVDEETWPRFTFRRRNSAPAPQTFTSVKQMAGYSTKMRAAGFYVLNYFNVTEFGAYVNYPPPPRKATRDEDLWKDGDDFLYGRLNSAIVRVPDGIASDKLGFYGKTKPGGPFYTWEDGIVLDSGEPVYKEFLLAQARRHIEKLPDSSGICIDRMDWLRLYNEQRDDGVSWEAGKPARSLYYSWRGLMADLLPLFHRAGKVVFVNNHVKRLDLLKDIDGILDEFTYNPAALNTTALLCLKRPALGWTGNEKQVRADPDGFFQRFLYMGVFPMAPYPGNDHSLRPSPWVDEQYLAYGPLMNAMRGRVWILEPHAVDVLKGDVVANLFSVPGGYIAPVMLGGAGKQATIAVRGVRAKSLSAEALHPGAAAPAPIRAIRRGDAWLLEVPLVRGCAMVKIAAGV